MNSVHIKRIYEPVGAEDGFRVLVDRLWPRGVKKETADIDVWLKGVTPSTALRTWFGHDPKKWKTFSRRYLSELQAETEGVERLVGYVRQYKTVTLLYAAKDSQHTHALVLQRYIQALLKNNAYVSDSKK